MKLQYITCSDPRDHNSFDELFGLWNIDPRVEIAVQMHPGKVSPEKPRYQWVKELVDKLNRIPQQNPNFAIHVNNDWCDEICNGRIPEALYPLFCAWHYDTKKMVVGRIQLNMPDKTVENFNPYKLKKLIEDFSTQKFIVQYNKRTKSAVKQLHDAGANFQILFDDSGGRGEPAQEWKKPVYPEKHTQGYAGGLSPENVADNLTEINTVAPEDKIWIDAEGCLQTPNGQLKPDGTPIKLFDVARAAAYIKNAIRWEQNQK